QWFLFLEKVIRQQQYTSPVMGLKSRQKLILLLHHDRSGHQLNSGVQKWHHHFFNPKLWKIAVCICTENNFASCHIYSIFQSSFLSLTRTFQNLNVCSISKTLFQ